MIENEDADWEVHQISAELHVPYAIIGGPAVQYWGEARFTNIEGVIVRRASSLDLEYIRKWLAIFGGSLETDDVIARFEQAWAKYGPR